MRDPKARAWNSVLLCKQHECCHSLGCKTKRLREEEKHASLELVDKKQARTVRARVLEQSAECSLRGTDLGIYQLRNGD